MDVTGSIAGTIRRVQGDATVNALYPGVVIAGTIRRLQGAGTVNSAATGSVAGTIKRISGTVTMKSGSTLSVAGKIRRIQGEALGGVTVNAPIAGVIRRIQGDAEGTVAATFSIAGTISRIRGKGGTFYNVTIKSKPLPAGNKLSDYAELFDMKAYCEFHDSLSFAITLKSDYERGDKTFNYSTYKAIINEQLSSAQSQFRHHIGVTPLEGFFGNMFQYHLVKTIPTDGRFKWFGVDFNNIPRPEIDSEFLATEIVAIE